MSTPTPGPSDASTPDPDSLVARSGLRTGLIAAGAVALLTALVVGVLLVAGGDDGDADTASGDTSTSATPTSATPTPTPTSPSATPSDADSPLPTPLAPPKTKGPRPKGGTSVAPSSFPSGIPVVPTDRDAAESMFTDFLESLAP